MVHKGFTCALSKLQRPGDLIVSPEMLHEFELLVPSCSVSLITILTIYKERSEILLSHFFIKCACYLFRNIVLQFHY